MLILPRVSGSIPVLVDCATVHQTIDGFGAANAPQGLDATNADRFFSLNAGAIGLSLLRLPFASNGAGGPPYYPETTTFYSDATLAAARGALVWAAPWTAMTASWKDNNSLIQGHLLASHFGDYASFLAGLQASMVANGAPTLYGMSPVNEPDLADGAVSYESMQMSAADMTTFIKNNLGPSLAALTPRPKLIAPECANWDNSAAYLSTLSADATAYGFIDIIATHQYAGTVAALTTTKKVWQTEMSDLGAFDASIANGLLLAGRVHAALTTGNVNAWHAWWTRGSQANGLALIGQNNDDTLTKRFFCFGQWSRFVRPGWVRVDIVGSVAGLSITAFKNPATGDLAIVLINNNTQETDLNLAIGTLHVSTLTPWCTSVGLNLQAQSVIGVVGNTTAVALPASSVTTLVGTGT